MKKESEYVGLFIINGVLARFVLILSSIESGNQPSFQLSKNTATVLAPQ